MRNHIYGIDIGGTTIKIGLFSRSGLLIEKWEIDSDKSNNGKNILNDIASFIKNNVIPLDDIIGYGFGVPGPVVGNTVLNCVNLGWKEVNIKENLKDLLENENIYVANDANVAALGETMNGASKGFKDSVMITLGTGVGSGVIIDGKIITGTNGAAGEMGHIKLIHEHGLACGCGNTGCLETVASATGLKNIFTELLAKTNTSSVLRSVEDFNAKLIFDAANNNDELALEAVDKFTYYIATAIQIITVSINPEIIVIGGGVSKAGLPLLDRIINHFKNIGFSSVKDTKIVLAKLGNDAGIFGAAGMVKV
ncbi:hypothetical protein CI105_03140 [Candidatus Izimaplasma bacterium ZiA1]|uniref:ROK family glucokinase n=1 Tax=Candidatus Izimoplasma sp. ZiA1 TaxID=2024899 RepID=UPI000BAA94DE|nr:hypothetical protein CI105_03140 [Candidatus Izimaplasma bacterium ZiA1]